MCFTLKLPVCYNKLCGMCNKVETPMPPVGDFPNYCIVYTDTLLLQKHGKDQLCQASQPINLYRQTGDKINTFCYLNIFKINQDIISLIL